MLNYVSHPTVEVIQILLIISNVLSYNMNAGASYTLLGKLAFEHHRCASHLMSLTGMTERMCLVLGLHVESTGFTDDEVATRRRVW